MNERISQECGEDGEFPEIPLFNDFGNVIYELASMCDNVVVDGTMFTKDFFKETDTDTTGITIKIRSTRVRVNLR